MTDHGRVQYGDTTIEYVVRRSKRRKKTVEIAIRDGGVRVAAPARTTDDQVRDFVLKRASWIIEKLEEERSLREKALCFVSGETLPYMGRDVTLAVKPADVRKPSVEFDHPELVVATPPDLAGDARYDGIREAIVEWYKARARVQLAEGVDSWWGRLGKGSRSRILIGDQKSRWGSCAFDGTLRFSWRVMMLEPSLIELVVVHELAHLTHRNHSDKFWGLVSSVLPDVQERRKRIREAGRRLLL